MNSRRRPPAQLDPAEPGDGHGIEREVGPDVVDAIGDSVFAGGIGPFVEREIRTHRGRLYIERRGELESFLAEFRLIYFGPAGDP